MLVNNRGDQIEAEVDLRDYAGNNYIWTPERLDTNFREYTFSAEDAVSHADIGSKNTNSGSLQYRFRLKGTLPEPRAVAIDMAQTLPFALKTRTQDLTVANVQDVGHTITRRFDENVLNILKTFVMEEGMASWVDANDDLHFEPAGGSGASQSIDYGTTPVTSTSFSRDYDRIVNKVTVQGSGQVQVTAVDESSAKFYGLSEREKQLVDRSIQTEVEATRRAKGFLQDHAWEDGAMSFEIADGSFEDVRVGEAIPIKWDPEDVNNAFIVTAVETDADGYVTIEIGGAQLG